MAIMFTEITNRTNKQCGSMCLTVVPMDIASKRALVKCQASLEDVEYSVISGELLNAKLISVDEHCNVKEAGASEKIKILISILTRKGPKAFESFVAVLKCDYDWISEKLSQAKDEEEDYLQTHPESMEHVFRRNGCPNLPEKLLRRSDEDILEKKLLALQAQFCLAITGSLGTGKTVLANVVIRSDEVLKKYSSGIYWIQCSNKPLLIQLKNMLSHFTVVQSDTSDSSDIQTILMLLSEALRSLYLEDSILMVLNDVQQKEIVKIFTDNLSCNFLITSRHLKFEQVVGRFDYYELHDGLSNEQSTKMLSLWTNLENQDLPAIKSKILKLSQRLPLLLIMVGHLLHMNDREDIWNHCYEILKRDLLIKTKPYIPDYQYSSIMLSFEAGLENLDLAEKMKLYSLIVFKRNAVVNSKVLQVLWKLDVHETELFADKLASMSLIHATWDNKLKQMKYSFKNLSQRCLKYCCGDIKKYHTAFISNYLSSKKYIQLVDDGYIHKYWVYHLINSEDFLLLSESIFDLNFMQKRIKFTNSLVVLQDLIEYQDLILKSFPKEYQQTSATLLLEIRNLLQIHGHDLNTGHSLVQMCLSYPVEKPLYKLAHKIARKKYNVMNLRCCLQNNQDDTVQVIGHDNIACAIFTRDNDKILVGKHSGDIKLCWAVGAKAIIHFIGHTKTITELAVGNEYFVSSSEDKSVCIWHLTLDEFINQEQDGITHHEQFRILSSLSTENLHDSEPHFVLKSHDAEVLTCDIHPKTYNTVSGDKKGLVIVFHFLLNKSEILMKGDKAVHCCRWCLNDHIAIAIGNIIFIKNMTGDTIYKSVCNTVGLVMFDTVLFYCDQKNLMKQVIKPVNNNNNQEKLEHLNVSELDSTKILEITGLAGFCQEEAEVPLVALSTNISEVILMNAERFSLLRSFKCQAENIKSITFSQKLEFGAILMAITQQFVEFWKIDENCVKSTESRIFSPLYLRDSWKFAMAGESGFQIVDCNVDEINYSANYTLSKVTYILILDDNYNLIYGCDDGNIFIHGYRDGCIHETVQPTSRSIYRHKSRVDFIYALNIDIIISIDSEGCMASHYLEGDIYQSRSYNNKTLRKAIQLSKPHLLLAWNSHGKYNFFNLKTNSSKCIELYSTNNEDIITNVSPCKKHMLTYSANSIPKLWVIAHQDIHEVTMLRVCSPTSSAFSYNSSLVGIGNIGGQLYVWRTSKLDDDPILIDVYTSAITCLQFDRTLSLVVTSGPYIAWSKLPSPRGRRHHFSGPSRSEDSTSPKSPFSDILFATMFKSVSLAHLNGFDGEENSLFMPKTLFEDNPESEGHTMLKRTYDCIHGNTLLQTHPIFGQVSHLIKSSKEFDSFFAVDNLGVVYAFWEIR